MRAIGFRAETGLVHYAVLDGSPESPVLVANDKLLIQQECSDAEGLHLLRTQLLSVLETHKPTIAAVRFSDRPQGQSNVLSMFARARVEGVVLEASASFGIQVIGAMSPTIKSGMKTKKPVREYVAEDQIRGINLSSIRNANRREAILVAISALGR